MSELFLKGALNFENNLTALSRDMEVKVWLYLAVLDLWSENTEMCLKRLVSTGNMLTAGTVSSRLLIILNDVSNTIGFLTLYKHLINKPKQQLVEHEFTMIILWQYLVSICRLTRYDASNFHPHHQMSHRSRLATDAVLISLTRHGINKFNMSHRHSALVFRPKKTTFDHFDLVSISHHDTLTEVLLKFGVNYMTRFTKLILGQSSRKQLFATISSHYKALYLYKKEEYLELLSLCQERLDNFDTADLEFNAFRVTIEDIHLRLPSRTISVLYPSHVLFDDDVVNLIALMNLCEFDEAVPRHPIKYIYPYITELHNDKRTLTPRFLLQYLMFRCAYELKADKRELMHQWLQLHSQLMFEHILRVFLFRKTFGRRACLDSRHDAIKITLRFYPDVLNIQPSQIFS